MSQRWRQGIFGNLFGTDAEERQLRNEGEHLREEALVENARQDAGNLMGGAASPQPAATENPWMAPNPQASQAHSMADPGGMVDATGMSDTAMAVGGGGTGATGVVAGPPAGWYTDPEVLGAMRYWSGASWSPSGVTPPGVSPPPPA